MIFRNLFKKWTGSSYMHSKIPSSLHNKLFPDSFNSKYSKSYYVKNMSTRSIPQKAKESTRNYVVAAGVLGLGLTFAAVPLYRIFCQATGFGGTSNIDIGGEKIQNLKKVPYRPIKVIFTSDVGTNLHWKFKPQQNDITVVPGETALAFYTATNPLDRPIIGISSYTILPYEAAAYFNKIQCFCFEEQMLNPKEQVDLPVFFYIDPEFCEDPLMENVNEVILSYTFFASKNPVSLKNLVKSSS